MLLVPNPAKGEGFSELLVGIEPKGDDEVSLGFVASSLSVGFVVEVPNENAVFEDPKPVKTG